ncbi:prepilin-type N-terminal cleavage/methylation domain-containing protein [Sphingomonas sp. QA11]|uniref:prepilin-type N-terminal cleavage/methylation domain-containing protein n=1 Tax=Sphingomonas sp. QA11 TaxID=2950605 RepID=UPI00234902CC|nr:prepilin-type N-terminal cleavage/methylation domain-containing protein [Sphingomonas sp. QA11]WCM28033.1 prepilin-type N-terminal cleavage/methylation domain-containing protein [Sphingomonas sp. QA11]
MSNVAGRRSQHPSVRDGAAGFTLIELLVSLALMGMAAALLLQGLAMAGVVAQRERASISGLEEVIAAQRLLRSGIERLRPVTRSDSALPIVELRGTAGILTFVGPPLDRMAPDALQRFRLTRTASGDLVLYSASIRKIDLDRDGSDLIGWTPNTLLRGVRDLSISYLGPARAGLDRGWQDRWWDRPQPPELIRIRIEFAGRDRRKWPDLIVRPRATTNAACRIDALTGRCGGES